VLAKKSRANTVVGLSPISDPWMVVLPALAFSLPFLEFFQSTPPALFRCLSHREDHQGVGASRLGNHRPLFGGQGEDW